MTLLPATVPTRTRPTPRFVVTVIVLAVVLLLVVVTLLFAVGGSKSASKPAAKIPDTVPKAAVFATSNADLPDTAGVIADAASLLAGKLPAAAVSAGVRDALVHPPAAGTATPMLGASLALDDPQLPACISSVTGGDPLYGIDRISFSGQPSLLIVTADDPTHAFAYVIGTGCALPGTGIRTVVTVPL